MSLTLVFHVTAQPALFGALAAVVARHQNARLLHLPAVFPSTSGADAVQHVAANGALVPSGLLWYERLTGAEIGAPSAASDIVEAAGRGPVVVPWHAPVQAVADLDRLLALAHRQGLSVAHWHVDEDGNCWRLRDAHGTSSPYGRWRRDDFGRWGSVDDAEDAHPPVGTALRIALIGAAGDQHQVYPATLAALGDAADALGVRMDIRCIAPHSFADGDRQDLDGVDGVLLPGGSDMGNVPGQLAVARQALHQRIPTLGLCLGMQTMTTALVQRLPGGREAHLAEAAPDAALKSFVPLAATPGLPAHRLGRQPLRAADAQTAALIGAERGIRCNHRFRLNPALLPLLCSHGLHIAATDHSGLIVDAIVYQDHPFYIGMQGHPEQSSRPESPHPLVTAFLVAAAQGAA